MHNTNFFRFVFTCLLFFVFAFGHENDPLRAEETKTVASSLQDELQVVRKYETASRKRWEGDIRKLEELDQTEQHPDDSILFIGSSSVRLWKTIDQDMAPYHPIRRGYGGAKYSDLAVFADRLVYPHKFRAVAMFVANDVTGSGEDHTTAEVELLVRNILRTIRKKAPTTPILIIEVTPTASRFKAWDKVRDVNAALRDICLTTPDTYFVATAEHYLDQQKQPITELFVADKLHLNEAGYDLWGKLIKRRLDDVLETEGTKSAEAGPLN